ncbi:hypothetical protein ACHAO1_010820 [Botrytis cinerea]
MPVTSSSSISPESEISSDSDGLCDAHPLRVSVLEVNLNAGIQYENEKLKAQELRNEALKDQPGQFNLARSSPLPAIGFGSERGGRQYNKKYHGEKSDQRIIESIEQCFTLEEEGDDDDGGDEDEDEDEDEDDKENTESNNGQRMMARGEKIERMKHDDHDDDGGIGSKKGDVSGSGGTEDGMLLGLVMDSEGQRECALKIAVTINTDTFSNADDDQGEVLESSTAASTSSLV